MKKEQILQSIAYYQWLAYYWLGQSYIDYQYSARQIFINNSKDCCDVVRFYKSILTYKLKTSYE